jgi:hypothetical protein
MEAFDIARENMEKILAQPAVSDLVEYGASEENPDIVWETTVEPCYEPITNNMWIRAVCTAKFLDESGQEQKVELIHWLTSLSKEQIQQILEQQRREEEYYDATGANGELERCGKLAWPAAGRFQGLGTGAVRAVLERCDGKYI